MLNAAEDEARRGGWLVISEAATPGLMDRLIRDHLPWLLAARGGSAQKRQLKGFSAPAGMGGLSWETVERYPPESGLRSMINALTEVLAKHATGLLITIDEILRKLFDDLRQIGTQFQHAFRENREVAFAGAWVY
ncbi:hypothetical protein GCM10011410_29340 [Hoyosella rhizosphaerae]|uniref:Uncharacterized protein n=2 Tax=Hoyosella rhizosphaerae TaxID=1755582 RepID=A0A916XIE2_9ACTN|nr:hypothetical protein [Hoyosella rhizosphaerae]GGC74211.1 hypothetical protein GCM10011410_29340 [Hoyosella rhizosphaerae]